MTTSMYLNWAPLTYLKGRANTTVDIVDGSGNVVDAFLNSKRLTNFTFIHVGVIDEAGYWHHCCLTVRPDRTFRHSTQASVRLGRR